MEKQEFIKKYRGSYPDVTGRTKWKNWDDVENEMDTDLENIFADRLSFMQKDLEGWQKENVKLKLEIGKLITDAGYLKNKK